jgi:hypothetical protein
VVADPTGFEWWKGDAMMIWRLKKVESISVFQSRTHTELQVRLACATWKLCLRWFWVVMACRPLFPFDCFVGLIILQVDTA